MATKPINELDFATIKSQFITYLRNQTQFRDYNFEGSNMNVLLDVLAYNTYMNNFYTNMAINEMFLDSAVLKNSVVSHAKELNYLPRSRTSCARPRAAVRGSYADRRTGSWFSRNEGRRRCRSQRNALRGTPRPKDEQPAPPRAWRGTPADIRLACARRAGAWPCRSECGGWTWR